MKAESDKASAPGLFRPLQLRNVVLRNRILRSATYEGMGEADGTPRGRLGDLYSELADGGVGAIVTGFVFTSQAGRAMQPAQCGMDADDKIGPWRNIVERVKAVAPDVRMFMQLAHAGRQTRRDIAGLPVVGASSRWCSYFRQKVQALDEAGVESVIREFACAAGRARQAGFDGVQLHAAHGYLIHQFLSPWTNLRRDRWADPPAFLEATIGAVGETCGNGFPLLVKLSAAEDRLGGIRLEDTVRTVRRLGELKVDAVEISYGTMEYALNIIRGDCPVDLVLNVNPLFNRVPRWLSRIWKAFRMKQYLARFIPFAENYNVEAAAAIRSAVAIPVIPVGGIRSRASMLECIGRRGLDAVSLCRPLICEPDLPRRLRDGAWQRSACTHCNLCTVYCDSPRSLRCYRKREGQT